MRGYEEQHYAVLGKRFVNMARVIGGGDTEKGIRLLEGLAKAMQQVRTEGTACGPYEALGKVGAQYRVLEKGVEKNLLDETLQRKAALQLMAETARFWLGEHDHA